MRYSKLFMFSVIAIAFVSIMYMFTKSIEADLKMYQAESKCVRDLVLSNIERRNIVTNNGTCSIKISN